MDKIGVLGKKDNKTIGAHVAYGPGPGKAARVRLFYHGVSNANSTLAIKVAGVLVMQTGNLQNNHRHYTTDTKVRMQQNGPTDLDGSTSDKTGVPFEHDFWLAPLDTIEYIIGGADFQDMRFLVVGVEVDV
jgi:hypothetical protein